MNADINLKAGEVWKYYQSHKKDCRANMMLIASCEDFGIEIYITEEVQNRLSVIVEADDIEVYRESVYSQLDCELTVRKVYGIYLTEKALDALTVSTEPPEDERFDDEDIQDKIEDRETELQIVFENLIADVIGKIALNDLEISDDVISDIKEHVLEYVARRHGIPVYRPMYLEDEDGKDFYEEYPYDCMVFEDEDK